MIDKLERLVHLLDRLPQMERIVYLLATADGMSHDAIAFRLGIPVERVVAHLIDGLVRISHLLDEPP